MDDEPEQIGRSGVPAVAVCGGLRGNLEALAAALGPADAPSLERAADLDRRSVQQRTAVADRGLLAEPAAPMDPAAAAHAIATHLPESATLVEEAITTGLLLRQALRIDRPGHFLHTIGGGLGWGIGAAIGARLGRPESPAAASKTFPGMDLDQPPINWPQLSRSLGVNACRVENAADLAEIVRTAGCLTEPMLVEAPVRAFAG